MAEVEEEADALEDLPLIRYDEEESSTEEEFSYEEGDGEQAEDEEALEDSAEGDQAGGWEAEKEALPALTFVEEEELDEPLSSLRALVADEPSDADGWRLLGEELFSQDLDDKGWEAMERAHEAYAENGDPEKAMRVVRELLLREPHRIELRQRVVEYAHRTNERTLLIQAFLELADGLRAEGESLKADAVFEQVLGLDPSNLRANEALSGTLPEVPRATTGVSEAEAVGEDDSGAGAKGEDYVDLGAMVLDEEREESTRWTVPTEEPTGDEEVDFARMLSQFKEKVAENISGEDARSHYDLGAAYKEMGLLGEAIGQFQQALRAEPENLAAFEILGECFLEQGEPEVAIRTLERGLGLPTPVEDDFLGVYYWLGQAHETVGNPDSARELYEKIFSLDINFKDVTDRLKALR